jgi:hypothetical protein
MNHAEDGPSHGASPGAGASTAADGSTGDEIPLGQRLYDNIFLLLAAGIIVMVLFFTVWGLLEITSLSQAPLP